MGEKEKILEIKDLSVSFNATSGIVNAIRSVSLELNRGETLAIVGESGSGVFGISNASVNNSESCCRHTGNVIVMGICG